MTSVPSSLRDMVFRYSAPLALYFSISGFCHHLQMSRPAVDITFHKKLGLSAAVPTFFITMGSYLSPLQMGLVLRKILLVKITM